MSFGRETDRETLKLCLRDFRIKERWGSWEEYKRHQQRKRYKNDPDYRLAHLLRSRIRDCLRNEVERQGAIELLGCSIRELKDYLEKQFSPEMNWSNHGILWEIDHIRPVASFDLNDIEQRKACFNFGNLRPLLAEENRQKSSIWGGRHHHKPYRKD